MPSVWLQVLLDEKIPDKATTLMKLKYEYTVDDVYDLLEFLNAQHTVTQIQNRRSQEEERNANR